MDDLTAWLLQKVPWLAPVVGGVLDYFRGVQTGERQWSFGAFLLHVGMAMFFGLLCGSVASGLGYGDSLSLAFAGFGGFLGVRVADFLYLIVQQRAGR